MPQAVNGMLIGLMGFMSTSPNELLLTSLVIFFFFSKPVFINTLEPVLQSEGIMVLAAGSGEGEGHP